MEVTFTTAKYGKTPGVVVENPLQVELTEEQKLKASQLF